MRSAGPINPYQPTSPSLSSLSLTSSTMVNKSAVLLVFGLLGMCTAQLCVQPITKVRCILDSTSGAVLRIQYGYWQSSSFYRLCGGNTPGTTPFTQTLSLNTSGGNPATQNTTFINGIQLMRYRNGRLPSRGRIPAIRFYLFDSMTNTAPGYVVCGNTADEANGLMVPSGSVLRSTTPNTYLGAFYARCSARNLVKDPTDAAFFVTGLYGLCWARAPNLVSGR